MCIHTHIPRGNLDHPQPSSGTFSSQGHWRNFGITWSPLWHSHDGPALEDCTLTLRSRSDHCHWVETLWSGKFQFCNLTKGFPGGLDSKESCCNARPRFNSWVRKIPWRREWQPTPVFLPGEFQGQRSLAGYSL